MALAVAGRALLRRQGALPEAPPWSLVTLRLLLSGIFAVALVGLVRDAVALL